MKFHSSLSHTHTHKYAFQLRTMFTSTAPSKPCCYRSVLEPRMWKCWSYPLCTEFNTYIDKQDNKSELKGDLDNKHASLGVISSVLFPHLHFNFLDPVGSAQVYNTALFGWRQSSNSQRELEQSNIKCQWMFFISDFCSLAFQQEHCIFSNNENENLKQHCARKNMHKTILRTIIKTAFILQNTYVYFRNKVYT